MSTYTPDSDDIFVWPCGTWCYREELFAMGHLSDDFYVLLYDTPEWHRFLRVNL